MDFEQILQHGFAFLETDKKTNKSYYAFHVQQDDASTGNVKKIMTDLFNDFFDNYMYKNKETIRFYFLNYFTEQLEKYLETAPEFQTLKEKPVLNENVFFYFKGGLNTKIFIHKALTVLRKKARETKEETLQKLYKELLTLTKDYFKASDIDTQISIKIKERGEFETVHKKIVEFTQRQLDAFRQVLLYQKNNPKYKIFHEASIHQEFVKYIQNPENKKKVVQNIRQYYFGFQNKFRKFFVDRFLVKTWGKPDTILKPIDDKKYHDMLPTDFKKTPYQMIEQQNIFPKNNKVKQSYLSLQTTETANVDLNNDYVHFELIRIKLNLEFNLIYTEDDKSGKEARVPIDVEAISVAVPYYDDTFRRDDVLKLKPEDIVSTTLYGQDFTVATSSLNYSIKDLQYILLWGSFINPASIEKITKRLWRYIIMTTIMYLLYNKLYPDALSLIISNTQTIYKHNSENALHMKKELSTVYTQLVKKFPTIYEYILKKQFRKYTKEQLQLEKRNEIFIVEDEDKALSKVSYSKNAYDEAFKSVSDFSKSFNI